MLLKAAVFFVVLAKSLVPGQCQTVEDRIIGGKFCEIEKIPYIVFLNTTILVFNGTVNYTTSSICGGSIINPSWVLSAAHCFSQPVFKAIHGVAISGSDYYVNGTRHDIREYFVHPDFNNDRPANDIALARLTETIKQPLTYPAFVKTKSETDKCTKGFIAGWGRVIWNLTAPPSDRLKCLHVTITQSPKKVCRFSKDLQDMIEIFDDGTLISILITDEGVTAFEGDSGGPLTCNGKLIGVTSFIDVEESGKKGSCFFYTKIERYFEFIAKHTGLKLPPWKYTENITDKPSPKPEEKSTSACRNSFPNCTMIILLLLIQNIFL